MYVLKSLKDQKLYFGSTNNLKRRFQEHQTGQQSSTKGRRPFILVYYEAYKSEIDARNREFQIKRGKRAYEMLKNRIENSIK